MEYLSLFDTAIIVVIFVIIPTVIYFTCILGDIIVIVVIEPSYISDAVFIWDS
jgi:hypothetical protein